MFDVLKKKMTDIEDVCTRLLVDTSMSELSDKERWDFEYREMLLAFALMEEDMIQATKVAKIILDISDD